MTELIPVFGIDVGLIEDASQSPDRDLGMFRHDGGVHSVVRSSHEFDVAALLAGLRESCDFEPTLKLPGKAAA
jgi:hypothetical protein